MQTRVVNALGEGGDVVPMKHVFDRPAAVSTERPAVLVVGKQRADPMGQTARFGIHEKTIHVMPNEFARAAGEGGNDRLAGRPRLQHDDPERFVTAWYDDDVAGAHQV